MDNNINKTNESENEEEREFQYIVSMLKLGPMRFSVRAQNTGRQLILPLPAKFVKGLKIRKGDIFIYDISLDKNGEIKYLIKHNKEASKIMNKNRANEKK